MCRVFLRITCYVTQFVHFIIMESDSYTLWKSLRWSSWLGLHVLFYSHFLVNTACFLCLIFYVTTVWQFYLFCFIFCCTIHAHFICTLSSVCVRPWYWNLIFNRTNTIRNFNWNVNTFQLLDNRIRRFELGYYTSRKFKFKTPKIGL